MIVKNICFMLKELRLLVLDFLNFFRHDFKPLPYCYAAVVIVLSIVFVYTTDIGMDFGKGRLPTDNKIVNNILVFNLIYFLVAIPVLIFQGKYNEISKPHFYLKGLLLMTVIAISDIFSWRERLDLATFSHSERIFVYRTLWRMNNLIFVLPVLVLLRLFYDKQVKGLYGLSSGNHHIKAYLSLYVLILPILIAVSFTSGFQSYYPIGKPWLFEGAFGHSGWVNTAFFEVVYMADFVMVELIFRGALVIGMGLVMGRSAVLPMVAVYVALHFGKPVLETMSAIVGGYFLGTLAYQTKHIWGGVIIHMGIAFAIEMIRFAQYALWGV
jgi:hypothetical protein